jgi:hypothetical protein
LSLTQPGEYICEGCLWSVGRLEWLADHACHQQTQRQQPQRRQHHYVSTSGPQNLLLRPSRCASGDLCLGHETDTVTSSHGGTQKLKLKTQRLKASLFLDNYKKVYKISYKNGPRMGRSLCAGA